MHCVMEKKRLLHDTFLLLASMDSDAARHCLPDLLDDG